MKKFLTLLLGIVAMSTPLLVGAQAAPGGSDFVALAPIAGLTDPSSVTSVINSQNLASFFNNLYKFCIGLAAALAVIMIIWGGLEISTQDSISKQGAGKEKIQNAIYGLLLVLSPVLVFSIINPAILNLSLNLRPLDTASVQPNTTLPLDATNGNIPFVDRTVAAPISGAWCSRDTGSQRLFCATTEDLCKKARSANSLLITEPCKFITP